MVRYSTSAGETQFSTRIIAPGFRSTIAGTLGNAAYGWTSQVHSSGPGTGLFHETNRLGLQFDSLDKAYWGVVNHNYVGTTFASTIAVSGQSNLGSGSILFSGVASPAQITSNQNDYAAATGTVNRISSDAARDITGMTAGVTTGHIKFLINVGAFNITLKEDNAGSSAANRFTQGADVVMTPGDIVICIYDAVVSRWRAGLTREV